MFISHQRERKKESDGQGRSSKHYKAVKDIFQQNIITKKATEIDSYAAWKERAKTIFVSKRGAANKQCCLALSIKILKMRMLLIAS